MKFQRRIGQVQVAADREEQSKSDEQQGPPGLVRLRHNGDTRGNQRWVGYLRRAGSQSGRWQAGDARFGIGLSVGPLNGRQLRLLVGWRLICVARRKAVIPIRDWRTIRV